jgi:hypothetical protein
VNAKTYFEHNAKRETAHEVVEWDEPEPIVVEERRISREEFEALLRELPRAR